MNSTANAVEIGLSGPTSQNPSADVTERPTKMLITTAAMILSDFSAGHKISRTTATVAIVLGTTPSLSVANSSSWIGTGPVSRTRAP